MSRNVTEFGAILNDTSTAARNANKTALINGWAACKTLIVGDGTLYLPYNAGIDIPQACQLIGQGRWEGQTAIKGDGQIFKINNAGGAESRSPLTDLFISNETIAGNLVLAQLTYDLGRCQFDRVNFGYALHHIACEGAYAVDWVFRDCKFEFATSSSRRFSGTTNLKDYGCMISQNYQGIYLGDEGLATIQYAAFGNWHTLNQAEAIVIVSNGAEAASIDLYGCYFESNGLGNGASDIQITTALSGVYATEINMHGGMFGPAGTTQATRIGLAAGAGPIDKVNISNVTVQGNKPLAPNTNQIWTNNNKYVGNNEGSAWRKATYA